ncbi:uncharacterized protein PSFLO_02694 [Pseudozyma flocculosa]|nr:uncharacterized protein PSFLO_02694 [Pseudozyma flocculosa]
MQVVVLFVFFATWSALLFVHLSPADAASIPTQRQSDKQSGPFSPLQPEGRDIRLNRAVHWLANREAVVGGEPETTPPPREPGKRSKGRSRTSSACYVEQAHAASSSTQSSAVEVGADGVVTKATIAASIGAGGAGNGRGAPCFPALDFQMPHEEPDSLDGWWCSQQDEYAFLGFSYGTFDCPSANQIRSDFGRMRNDYSSRYVRIYSVCDREGFQDDLINAAWEHGLGLHMLLWFGFDGGDVWKTRKRTLMQAIQYNPRAPFVVRAVVVGSEPLYDWALDPDSLAVQIRDFRQQLAPWTQRGDTGMQVTLSDLAYGFQLHDDAPQVFAAVDVSEANVLPFLDPKGTTGDKAFTLVKRDYEYFASRNSGKKVYMTQTGWPSDDSVFKPNSKDAVASVAQERAYFEMLDDQCPWMKGLNQGGVGW